MDTRRADFIAAAIADDAVRARYWAKVELTSTSHWWFTGAIMRSGHGQFWIGSAGRAHAIRAAVLAGEDVAEAMRAGMSDLDRSQLTLF